MVILHISDLHFGMPAATAERAARSLALSSLAQQLANVEDKWRPTSVLVGGDLVWSGSREEFDLCGDWLESLLQALEVPKSALATCAGNHDVSRQEIRLARPATTKAADEALSAPLSQDLLAPFQNYLSFCSRLGVTPLRMGAETSHIVGTRALEQCNLLVLNTAWFCRDQEDRGRLWLGYPLLEAMSSANQLAKGNVHGTTALPTIALLHHPFEWLNDSELNAYGRPSTRDYLASRAHLVLSGHTHGEPRLADRIAGAAYHLRGGAAHDSAYYPNSVNLIRVVERGFEVRTYQYDFRDATHAWVLAGRSQAQSLSLNVGASALSGAPPSRIVAVQDLKAASGQFAESLVESRSRLVTPEAIPHLVDVRVRFAKRAREPWIKDRERQPSIPLAAATAESRRLLVTGDLGSGKTTLTARFVSQLSAKSRSPLPVLIPARALELKDATTGDFLHSVSAFVSGEIAPALPDVSLRDLLDDGVEIVLIVDGIDEVGLQKAPKVLHFLDRVVASWPSVTAIATTRPIEGASFELSAWDVVATAPMDYVEWRQLFASEAEATGLATKDAQGQAELLAERVGRTSALANLARTPLGSRLLARSLLRRAQALPEPTLGDLFYDLVEERVWTWASRASRPRTTQLFEDVFADAASRSRLLGQFAFVTREIDTIGLTQAHDALSGIVPNLQPVSDVRKVGREAVEFFAACGLIEIHNDLLRFSWKALQQFLIGVGLAEAVRTERRQLADEPPDAWREVAFAVTALRRWGVAAGSEVSDYIFQRLAPAQNATQACYVVAEFNDAVLATALFRQMDRFGWRPLVADWDEWLEPARIVAQAMTLAGDSGFEWFFKEYLTPEDPWVHIGSKLPEDVFRSWARLQNSSITPSSARLLDSLVRPLLVADSIAVIGIIPHVALLRPSAFSVLERAWFISQLLNEDSASSVRVASELGAMVRDGAGDTVRRVLEERCWRSPSGSGRASSLWFELFDGLPPLSVLRAAVSADRNPRHTERGRRVRETAAQRLGAAGWLAFCRWCLLSRDTHLSAGAALELHDRGDSRLRLIGEPLVGGLHDGAYIKQAEEALHRLVQAEGHRGVSWLASQMERLGIDAMTGSHSALWRIFLSELDRLRPETVGDAVTAAAWSLGSFILPRYAEIRRALTVAITEGTHKDAIVRTLYALLESSDTRLRHNAAAILLAGGERGVAPVIALVETLPFEERGSWLEWQDYFISLPLEPSVLSAVRKTVERIPAQSAEIVLRLLRKNGVTLTREEKERLVNVGLERHWNLASELNDGDSALREILLERLHQGSPAAARCLIGQVRPDSDEDLDARLLALDGSFYNIRPFMAIVDRMRSDAGFAERVSERGTRLRSLGQGDLALDLVRSAFSEPHKWDSVIWRILGGGERVLGVEDDNVQVLLRISRTYPDLRGPLSSAVMRLSQDTQLTSRNSRARQWLALLANELGEQSLERLEGGLRTHSVNDGRLRSALAARFRALGGNLDAVPRIGHDGVASVPTRWTRITPPEPSPDLPDWIAKRVWDSEGLDEQALVKLEQLFAYASFSASELGNLAAAGDEGTLVAAVVAMCFGHVENDTSPVLILKKRPFSFRRRDEPAMYQLSRGWNAYLAVTASHDTARDKFLRAVEASFDDPLFDRPMLLSTLRELGHSASARQLAAVVTEWPSAQGSDDGVVLTSLASALSGTALPDDERGALQSAIHAALGQFAAFGSDWGRSSALRQLGLPLLQWKFGHEEHDAIGLEVFAHGFVSLFKGGDVTDVEQAFEDLAPFIEQLSPDRLARAVEASRGVQGGLAQTVGWLVQALLRASPSAEASRAAR